MCQQSQRSVPPGMCGMYACTDGCGSPPTRSSTSLLKIPELRWQQLIPHAPIVAFCPSMGQLGGADVCDDPGADTSVCFQFCCRQGMLFGKTIASLCQQQNHTWFAAASRRTTADTQRRSYERPLLLPVIAIFLQSSVCVLGSWIGWRPFKNVDRGLRYQLAGYTSEPRRCACSGEQHFCRPPFPRTQFGNPSLFDPLAEL